MDRPLQPRRWPLRRWLGIGVGCAVILLLAWLTLSAAGPETLRVERERLVISVVQRGPFVEEIAVQGTVLPLSTVYLDAVEGGRVVEVFVEDGALVDAGAKILRLENTALELELIDREADLVEQQNNLRLAELALNRTRLDLDQERLQIESQLERQRRRHRRTRSLFEEGLVSLQELEAAESELEYLTNSLELNRRAQAEELRLRERQTEQLRLAVARLDENLRILSERRKNLIVRAPIRGRLTAFDAEVGQSKQAGDRLGQIDGLEGFKVQCRIDQHYLAQVEVGQSAWFRLEDTTHRLRISKIFPQVESGAFEAELRFVGEPPTELHRGQTVHLRLRLGGTTQDSLLLPRGPFFQSTGGRWVFVVDSEGNQAHRRAIQLGRQNTTDFEILAGLHAGDRVITSSYRGFTKYEHLLLEDE